MSGLTGLVHVVFVTRQGVERVVGAPRARPAPTLRESWRGRLARRAVEIVRRALLGSERVQEIKGSRELRCVLPHCSETTCVHRFRFDLFHREFLGVIELWF